MPFYRYDSILRALNGGQTVLLQVYSSMLIEGGVQGIW